MLIVGIKNAVLRLSINKIIYTSGYISDYIGKSNLDKTW